MKPVYFFLGANSEEGFFSLYDQLLGGRLDDLMILKRRPGLRQVDLHAPHGRGDGARGRADRVHQLLG